MRDILGIIKRVHGFGFQERGWNLWLDADHSTWSKAGGIRARRRRSARPNLRGLTAHSDRRSGRSALLTRALISM